MARPPWEVADVIQRGGSRFLDGYHKSLTYPQVKVLNAITRCRTAALGGHRDQCDRCGHPTISYNSFENVRHPVKLVRGQPCFRDVLVGVQERVGCEQD